MFEPSENPISEGVNTIQVNSYLFFDGQCEAAFQYYADCFGGSVVVSLKYGEHGSEAMGEEAKHRIMHATLQLGNTRLMASDCPPGRYQKPQGYAVAVNLDNVADVDRVFGKLAEGGQVNMPLTETFWSERFGMLTDRFGTHWMIGVNKPMPQAA